MYLLSLSFDFKRFREYVWPSDSWEKVRTDEALRTDIVFYDFEAIGETFIFLFYILGSFGGGGELFLSSS